MSNKGLMSNLYAVNDQYWCKIESRLSGKLNVPASLSIVQKEISLSISKYCKKTCNFYDYIKF